MRAGREEVRRARADRERTRCTRTGREEARPRRSRRPAHESRSGSAARVADEPVETSRMQPRHEPIAGVFLLSFSTSEFDIATEPPNDINPIAGRSFLDWIGPRLVRAGYRVSEPWTEDWGWCVEAVDGSGRRLLLGASAHPDEGDEIEWTLNLSRWRTPLEWLRREKVLARDDPFVRLVAEAVSGPGFRDQDLTQPTRMGFWQSLGDRRG
jgi:hypothetical protein